VSEANSNIDAGGVGLRYAHSNLRGLKQELLALFDQETDKRAISLLINWFKQLVVHGRRDQMD
jgi:hypothetical protein